MDFNIETLSPADFFPLLSLIRKSMAAAAGHYIDPLKVYPRFLKPKSEFMKNHIAARSGEKLIAAASIFSAEYSIKNEMLKAAEVLISAEANSDAALLKELLQTAEEMARTQGCDLIFTNSSLPSDYLAFDNEKAYTISRDTICENEEFEKVFAFMNPKVLTKYDKEALKSIYTALPHELLPDDELFAALASRNREPIVIKDSKGGVVGLLLCDSYNCISSAYFKSTEDIKDILKAYFIFYQLKSLSISPSPFDKALNMELSKLSGEVKEIKNPFSFKLLNQEKADFIRSNINYLPPII